MNRFTDGEGAVSPLVGDESQRNSSHLTPREVDILELIADGMCDKEIAVQLGIRVRTVRTHLERLFARNGLTSRSAAVRMWMTERQVAMSDRPERPARAVRD